MERIRIIIEYKELYAVYFSSCSNEILQPPPPFVNLLWITPKWFGTDLAATTQLGVSKALSERGCKISFVAPDEHGRGAKVVNESGHMFHAVKRSRKPGLGSFTFTRSLKRMLPPLFSVAKFDVALVEWQCVSGSHRALDQVGIPWLIVDRSPPVFTSLIGRLQWVEYRRAWRLASESSYIKGSVLKSQALADWHHSKRRLPEGVTIMQAGVEVQRYTQTTFPKPLTIVHHGQLDFERDIERLVKIGDVLQQREVLFRMHIVGRGNRLQVLQEASLSRDWLEVSGPISQDEVPEYLSSGSLALFPLPDRAVWRLASPLKIREWAAAGIPMILSDITPHRSLGNRSWIRYVRPDASIEDWVGQIQNLLDEDLSRLGEQARSDAVSEFDWVKTTDALYQTLSEIIGPVGQSIN